MKTEGLSEFADELRDFADEIDDMERDLPEAMDEGTKSAAENMRKRMRKLAPAGTSGDLKRSITKEQKSQTQSSVTYAVGPDHSVCDYAEYVEYGTGSQGERGGSSYYITPDGLDPQQALAAQRAGDFEEVQRLAQEYGALAWDGADHPVLVVEHPGIESQRFFRKAFAEAVTKDSLVRNLNKVLEGVFEANMK